MSIWRATTGRGSLFHGRDHRRSHSPGGVAKYVDQASGVSARFSLANYRAMIATRQRAIVLGETPAVPRISDLGHLYAIESGQTGTGPDGQSSDVRAAGAGCHHCRGS